MELLFRAFQFRLTFGSALKETFKEGYGIKDFKSDLLAGVIVAMVAIPLGMALAIAVGVPPEYGLYTIIFAAPIAAIVGGSRYQVTGPTAAFVVILAPVVSKFGLGGLLTATLMAGILLVLMSLMSLGKAIQFIPNPVTTGFTSGIAVVIATIQVKDFFGLQITHMPESYIDRIIALAENFGSFSVHEFTVALATLLGLILWPKINKKIPAPVVVLNLAALGVWVAQTISPELQIATIANKFTPVIDGITFHGIPQMLPSFDWPWHLPGPKGEALVFDWHLIKALTPAAVAIALLGAIESLLSAVVADGMTGKYHQPDSELLGQGLANIVGPFFGGIAATGAIARTATNIRYGAKSPLASVIHSLFVLMAVLFFARLVGYLPMAALSALLILVAYNMSDYKHFLHITKVAPRSDVVVLLTVFALTILFDMVTGVTVGMVAAALLLIRKVYMLTSAKQLFFPGHHYHNIPLTKNVQVYEINGPMLFGAAERAVATLSEEKNDIDTLIFILEDVPVIDYSGLVALETAVSEFRNSKGNDKNKVILVGLQTQPKELFIRSKFFEKFKVDIYDTLEEALKRP